MHPNIEKLRSIKSFNQLVKYLRDELDWPIDIESEHFDDLTFDYDPEELGIDAKTAVKIKEIKQLRPLVARQPWGIFFINFEPKQLPIVVLRRILRSLVVKKRSSAAKAHQVAWSLHDLLFISSYGESEHREITFAHFSEPADRLFGDLPTLRVLGWDDDDTKLKIDHVVSTLSEKMRWPEDENNTEMWRRKWSDAFELRPREVITTSKELAIRLADLAKSIRQRANLILSVESERGPLRKLHKAFQTTLIHDLKEDDFADMYAQTIAYGLLAARVSRPAGVVADNLADMVPITNPFLKEMLGTFLTVGGRKGKIDFDELGIQEVVDLLNNPNTNMDAILRDFGKRTMQEDPVIHFYELFLKEYDKKKKVERGVFYTPQPVVSYIVRSVHELLKTEFGLEDGLASTVTWGEMSKKFPPHPHGESQSNKYPLPQGEGQVEGGVTIPKGVSPDEPFVQILDPATGTATFLVEVIEVIYNTMTAKWKRDGHLALESPGLWNEYVPKHLLPRLFGFELMMAPYAIAHMKIGLKLAETGYKFSSNERAHIYLTNSLEPPSDMAEQPEFEELSPALAHEAKEVNGVKRNKRFTVVIGNPPYSIQSANLSETLRSLVEVYKWIEGSKIKERNQLQFEKNIQDDYIKFIRYAEKSIESSNVGIIGLICNNSFLDGRTFRGVRAHLLKSMRCIDVLDLHGSGKKSETLKTNAEDQNVFDIQQGVCILLARQIPVPDARQQARCFDLFGMRQEKYKFLMEAVHSRCDYMQVQPTTPFYLFVAVNKEIENEYYQSVPLQDIFIRFSSGVKTHRDKFAYAFDEQDCRRRLSLFIDSTVRDTQLRADFSLEDSPIWKLEDARKKIRNNPENVSIIRADYRPFDKRYILYSDFIVRYTARPTMKHMLARNNIALIVCQQQVEEGFRHVFVTRDIADCCAVSNKSRETTSLFPLYVKVNDTLFNHRDNNQLSQSNIKPEFIKKLSDLNGINKSISPQFIFHYIYAVLHSQQYRIRYIGQLRSDFPRVCLISNNVLFEELSNLGNELVALHLMESPKLDKHISRFVGKGNPEVEKVSYSDETVWIDKAKSLGFKGVPENVWNLQIGGYQVCEKWLKDRKGRTLSTDDINHYHRIAVALQETIRLMTEIDVAIDAHGGWPRAFMNKEEGTSKYKVDSEPLPKAAEETPSYIPKRKDITE